MACKCVLLPWNCQLYTIMKWPSVLASFMCENKAANITGRAGDFVVPTQTSVWVVLALQVSQFLRWAGLGMARWFPLPLCPACRSPLAMAALNWRSPPWLKPTVDDTPCEPPMDLDKRLVLLSFSWQVGWWSPTCLLLSQRGTSMAHREESLERAVSAIRCSSTPSTGPTGSWF